MPSAQTPPNDPKKGLRTAQWVDELIRGFNLAAPPPADEKAKRELIHRFAELDQSLREGRIPPPANQRAGQFRRQFYAWLLQGRASGAGARWSLGELEASPLLSNAERRRWAQLKGSDLRARYMFNALGKRVTALFKLMGKSAPITLKGRTFAP
jgi:hypothetical protein